jgi:hypothetical protein
MRFARTTARTWAVAIVAVGVAAFTSAPAAGAAAPAWSLQVVAEPTHFSANDPTTCGTKEFCDRYQLLVTNVGDAASSGEITVSDTLPEGVTATVPPRTGTNAEGTAWACTIGAGNTTVTCTFPAVVPAGGYAPFIDIAVSSPSPSMTGPLLNETSVSGGGAPASVSVDTETEISSELPEFDVSRFAFDAATPTGESSSQAGGHPWTVTTVLGTPLAFSPPGDNENFTPAANLKTASVELPAGFVGYAPTVDQCTQAQLNAQACPSGSRVGTFAVIGGGLVFGEFTFTEDASTSCCSAVYNITPQRGYPAEFGFTFASIPVYLYANLVHTPHGYRLRISSPGIPAVLETADVSVTFYGDPGAFNGSESDSAFLSNPADCGTPEHPSVAHLEAWEKPGHVVSGEAVAYREITGCGSLHFGASLEFAPSPAGEGGTTEADEPSAYSVDLKIPQTSSLSELATPALRNATVTLPEGVSVSPSAAAGLAGCAAEGPTGINIGSSEVDASGRDLGNPEATEFGAGHAGGNGSPYDDAIYHTAPGHCPEASILGTVEVFTPLLPTRCGGEGQAACQPGESSAPLQGHIYLAQPKCGGAGQPACTEASATNGELYGGYIEVEGSGVIVKLPGSIAADPQTGQLTGTFEENPQFPFSEFKLHFHGGPRAPVANPQTCGAFTPTSILSSWASPQLPDATPISPSFGVDWDGNGGACPATLPFAPGFSAGTTVPTAGGFSPFVLTFSRQDREQNLSGLTETMPPGLLGKIAGIPLCGEAQANAGTCALESQLGSTSVTAGPGSSPLSVTGGRVYLTTGYKGAPFGLSIVVPAVAGPFNLGNVVVRAAIHIDPNTSQVTVVSDPLPQFRDGVPFRLRTVNVTVDRPGFIFNPTNCSQQQVTATITGAQGASASVASPFAVAGCAGLPFKPSFSVSTQGKTSKANGASLTVKVAQKPGEANIRKVQLQLPKILPARLTTLQKACIEAQFNANPAGCPAGSVIGTAKAITPILNTPLTGPAYLVSHGGAAFPDVEFLLQGEGVQITLDGKTDIKKGVTYSRFETVPDAPISSFETVLPQGPHSALAANGNLCATTKVVSVRKRTTVRVHGRKKHIVRTVKRTVSQSLVIPTTIVGQNGAQVVRSTKVAVTGCAKAKKTTAKKKHHKDKSKKARKN